MKKIRRRKLRLKNKKRFALFVVMLTIGIIALITHITTNSAGEPSYACSIEDYGVLPESKVVYVEQPYTEKEVEMLAKTVYGEAYVTNSKTEMSAVVWCILNRVDTTGYGCGRSIEYVITFPGQFSGYSKSNPVKPELDALVRDVLNRWCNEKNGCENVGRTLPEDYLYFIGDGRKNHFTKEWKGTEYWNWSLKSPYES